MARRSSVTQQDWSRIDRIFQAALDLPENERSELLDRECVGDPELRAAVVDLIEADDRAGSFLEQPLFRDRDEALQALMGRFDRTTPREKPDQSIETGTPAAQCHPVLIGPYRIEGTIGAGGMGLVLGAWDERLQRRVAIKLLHPGKKTSGEQRERLIREARAIAGITHPSIAQAYDIVSQDDSEYLVMEFVEGTTLRDVLRSGRLELRRALELGRQICEGLRAAHSQGLVHRDLKAANIMVTPQDTVKILDFGIVKQSDAGVDEESLTEDGALLGTVQAMSPEQAAGQELNSRSDLFSFGILLYEMTTGRHPFRDQTPHQTLQRILRSQPSPPSELDSNLPSELDLLVAWLLEKRPSRRPKSAGEVARALADLASRTGAGSEPSSALDTLSRLARRRRLLRRSGLAALAAVIAAGILGWLWTARTAAPLSVAVLAPEPQVATSAAEEELPLAAEAFRASFSNTLASLTGLVALDTGLIDEARGTPLEVARAVGADEVVAATYRRQGNLVRCNLRRLHGRTGALLWSGVVEVSKNDLQLLADNVAAVACQAYPDHPPRQERYRPKASAETYEHYLRLVLEIRRQGAARGEELLDELAGLREQSPLFLEAQYLEASVARYLFEATHRPEFLERARSLVVSALRSDPGSPNALSAAVEVSLAAGELQQAERYLEALRQAAPGNPMTVSFAATLAEHRGDTERYHALIEQRARDFPSWRSYCMLGRSKLSLGFPQEARRYLERARQLAPESYYVKSQLGRFELWHGDPRRAAALYGELAHRQPVPVYLNNAGLAEMLAGRVEAARHWFELSLETTPDRPTALLNLADCYSLLGEKAAAERLYRQTLAAAEGVTDPNDRQALSARAQSLVHLGRHREAVAAAQRYVQVAPDDPESLFVAALVYAVIGEKTSAKVAIEGSLERGLNPRWFEFSWFDELRQDQELRQILEAHRLADGTAG